MYTVPFPVGFMKMFPPLGPAYEIKHYRDMKDEALSDNVCHTTVTHLYF